MPTNNKEYINEYMRSYNNKNSYDVICPFCDSITKKYLLPAHNKTKKHQQIVLKLSEFKSLNKNAPSVLVAF